jgi:phosphoribosyl 1,2-cyclic phosphodiesterase
MNSSSPASASPFRLRFRGVRGSVPVACPSHFGIGGNTPCMELLCDPDEPMIFDAGTGIRSLGKEVAARAQPPRAIHIFFTHFHWDHLQGLPYFLPLYMASSNLIFYSAHPPEQLRAVLAGQMKSPYFPVLFEHLGCRMEFRQIDREPQTFGGVNVSTFPLHHPQGSVGYRIADDQKIAVYATDHEHGDAPSHAALLEHSRNADILIYDAQYTPSEYASRRGWGHSTWLEGTRLAVDAGVEKLVLFHHDPERDDDAVRRIQEEACRAFPNTLAAHETLEL